ncbi:dickkopf-like protein 1 isoform X2 [Anolis sagrei]|uniref:dickkopf-like protein 1 isoform X2 n=1 Tax=Anolis sagrei TaxID=38937 RepID=UPI0035223C14
MAMWKGPYCHDIIISFQSFGLTFKGRLIFKSSLVCGLNTQRHQLLSDLGSKAGSGSSDHRMKDWAKIRILLLVWGLWYLAAVQEGATAPAAFLFPSVERLFQDTKKFVDEKNENNEERTHQNFMKIIEDSLEVLGKEKMDLPSGFNKLNLDYHSEKKRQKAKNATLYSQQEVMKEKMPEVSQQERSLEADRQDNGNRFLNFGLSQPRPRLFLIYHFPQHLKSEQQVPEANWLKEEPVSDRRHRLLAIRNGLLAAPRPIKKKALLVTPTQPTTPRKRRFFFFWRKI